MFVLRKQQLNAIHNKTFQRFENKLKEHLYEFYPGECEALGEAGLADTIGYGLQKANSYSILTEQGICKYFDLMFVLGRDFDTDSQLPWAMEILKQPSANKIDKLYFRAIEYLDQVKTPAGVISP